MSTEKVSVIPRARLRPHGSWVEAIRQMPARPGLATPPPLAELLATVDIPRLATALHVSQNAIVRVVRMLVEGNTFGSVLPELGVPEACIRQLGHHLGWSMTWRRQGLRRQAQVGSLARSEVVRRCQAGESAAAVGRLAGVTRERIRQICQQAGLPSFINMADQRRLKRTNKELVQRQIKKETREKQRALQRALRHEHLTTWLGPAQVLWRDGARLCDIARSYGMSSNSLCWHMHTARLRFGPTWFPPRRKLNPAVPGERDEDLRQRWLAGETVVALAKSLGCTPGALRSRISIMRLRLGEVQVPRRGGL